MTDEASPPHQTAGVPTGTLIMGTYKIEKLINAGGMGEVYRGHNIHNGEPVAIKIVLPAFAADPKYVSLLQKESTILSRLSHEAIVRYHVFTNDPAIGRPCLVMEFVSGISLAQRMTEGSISLGETRAMFRRIAAGLERAHRAGVVHRDLSPDNVILEDGMVEQAKIIDFGIAKSSKAGPGTLLQGQLAGKLSYMSPEQLGAFGGEIDGRSDVYSLALMIAGACQGEAIDMGNSIADAVTKRSSVPDLGGVYPELGPLLARMLEPDPGRRPESMTEVIALLNRPAPTLVQEAPPRPDVQPVDLNRTHIGGKVPLDESSWAIFGNEAVVPQERTLVSSAISAVNQPTVVDAALEEDDSPFGAPSVNVLSTLSVNERAEPAKAGAAQTGLTAEPEAGGRSRLVIAGLAAIVVAVGAAAWLSGVLGPKKPDDPISVQDFASTATIETSTDPASTTVASEAASDAAAGRAESIAQEIDAARQKAGEAAAQAKMAATAAGKVSDPAMAEAEAGKAEAAARLAASQRDLALAAQSGLQTALKDAAASGPAGLRAKAAADSATASLTAIAASVDAAGASAAKARATATARTLPLRQRAWLASFEPAPCTFLLTPQPDGPLSLKGVAADPASFDGLSRDFASEFGAAPAIDVTAIEPEQCAVLDLANLNSGTASRVKLTGMPESLKSGNTLEARVEGSQQRGVRLFLINEAGGVYSLAKWTKPDGNGTHWLSVPLGLDGTSGPRTEMIMALATETPLSQLETIGDGYTARTLMPRLQWWLDQSKEVAAIAIQPIRLEP
jgi:serine/threonine-protein kinase